MVTLSSEQQAVIDAVNDGRDVIVEATVGSGKTSTIQMLCDSVDPSLNVLYLTYSRLLKADAQRRITGAKVQNYHGIVYPSMKSAGLKAGLSDSIRVFNREFKNLSAEFPTYDLIVIDEYQDINEEYAQLLRNIKSLNPLMQTVMVGDMEQKLRSDTTLNAQAFALEFCEDPEMLPFTQSFRVGPDLGDLLSQAWNKPVTGVNTTQQVSTMDYDKAIELISSRAPGDLLVLGKRGGDAARALNQIEKDLPAIFNKTSVYASIKDSDSTVTYDDTTAVFTTFDSSKGMERPVSVVFDYDQVYWELRNNFPDADPEILRNVFLVAASRGKEQVVFVEGAGAAKPGPGSIGFIPVSDFLNLKDTQRPLYKRPFTPSSAFDFTYAENVEACFDLLDVKRLDDGRSMEINVDRNDGLIDLSPVVGRYQEAMFFDGFDAGRELDMLADTSPLAVELRNEVDPDDLWFNCLLLTAVSTGQIRYAKQVSQAIPDDVRDALTRRLATLLPRNARTQVWMEMEGLAVHDRSASSKIKFAGIADAVHHGMVFELKFVSELSHPMFLQLALYLVMSGHKNGVLWNTRTDERWKVSVPDKKRFMNAVILCVTKQSYRVFK